MENTQLYNPNN